jgi:myo-inositol 2-dehydrogenase/D-chiro-inositol 1-dehydrogenase
MTTAGLEPPPADGGRFRLGLIGAGRMGLTHRDAIAGSATVEVTAIVEPYATAQVAASSPGIPVYAGLAELLAAGGIDGVLIAVPTDRHLPVVRDVMAAGLPALCEKPCGLSAGEAAGCAAAAEQAGQLLQIAYWRRFVPGLAAIQRRIRAGELGEILAVNCYQWDATPPAAEFRDSSGGIFADMGVHEFDQVRWLTGQEFSSVQVAASRLSGSPGDPDCGQIVAELDGGGTAMISLGRWHPAGDSCKAEVFGTAGTASSEFLPPDGGDAPFHEALRLQAEDFAQSARAGAPGGGASVGDAIVALTIADQAAAQLTAGSPLAAETPAH